MSIGSGIAIYFLIWWVTLFTVLPLKIKSQHEGGDVVPGSESGAPINPNLKFKLILNTGLSFLIFGVVYYLMVYKPIPLSSVPYFGSL